MGSLMEFALHSADEIAEELGSRVRAERLARELTQRTLAAMAGVSLPTVQRFERDGSGTMATFLALLGGLGRVDDLAEVCLPRRPETLEQALADRGPTRQRGRR